MITEEAKLLVEEMIAKGWQFMLVWSDFRKIGQKGNNPTWYWEADFSIQKPDGLYDNHESGFHDTDPNEAIKKAYQNVKDGKRLKR